MEINLFDKKKDFFKIVEIPLNIFFFFFLNLIQLKRGIPKLEPIVSVEFLKEVTEFEV